MKNEYKKDAQKSPADNELKNETVSTIFNQFN